MRRLLIACAATLVALPALAQGPSGPSGRPQTPVPATDPATGSPVQTYPYPSGRSIAERLRPSAETCDLLVRGADGKLSRQPAPTLNLISTNVDLTRPTVAGKLEGVYCERDSMVPAEDDDRVPRQFGVPLFINGPGGVTTVAIKAQRYQITFSKDATMTAAQQAAVREVVARWESRSPTRAAPPVRR